MKHKEYRNRPLCKPLDRNWRSYKYARTNKEVDCSQCISKWNWNNKNDKRRKPLGTHEELRE